MAISWTQMHLKYHQSTTNHQSLKSSMAPQILFCTRGPPSMYRGPQGVTWPPVGNPCSKQKDIKQGDTFFYLNAFVAHSKQCAGFFRAVRLFNMGIIWSKYWRSKMYDHWICANYHVSLERKYPEFRTLEKLFEYNNKRGKKWRMWGGGCEVGR